MDLTRLLMILCACLSAMLMVVVLLKSSLTRVTDSLQRLKRFSFGERTCVTIGINTLLLDHHKHITLDSYQVCQFMQ